jgi:hypothetical protein
MNVTPGNYDGASSKLHLQFKEEIPCIMAISNELSSEIAAAILAKKDSPQDLLKLRQVVLDIHSALQKMSEETHTSRLRAISMNATSQSPDRHRR